LSFGQREKISAAQYIIRVISAYIVRSTVIRNVVAVVAAVAVEAG
jgi:hypothetical protein